MMKKKNVLLIMADQQRYDTIAAAGFPHVKTPNLDRLAALGTVFTQACSTNPVCMPARHDLLTGLPGCAHGYYGNCERPLQDYSLPTLPRLLQNGGYRTAAVGKCHHYPAREHHGFGELHLMEELPVCRADDEYAEFLAAAGLPDVQNLHGVRPLVYHTPQDAQMPSPLHGTNWVADRTVRWLRDNGAEPFFLFCGFIHPHPPWDLPPECRRWYDDVTLPEPVPVSRRDGLAESGRWFGDDDSPETKRRIRAAYFASITLVDQAVGRILDELEASGQLDDTMIIYTADHGEMLQDKGYYSKEMPYESSVRIPLVVKFPRNDPALAAYPPGRRCPASVDLFDLLPTCLETAGLTYPAGKYRLPGESLRRAVERNREIQLSSFHGEPAGRWVMARTPTAKYVYRYNGGVEELYDLAADPGETRNLYAIDAAAADKSAAPLRQAVLDWEKNWGPEWSVKDGVTAVFPATSGDVAFGSKFPRWLNRQFQTFQRSSPETRGSRFALELEQAVPGYDFSLTPPEFLGEFETARQNFGSPEIPAARPAGTECRHNHHLK